MSCMILAQLIFFTLHFLFLIYITFFRSVPPYKLSRWDKQLLENLFVILMSWLAYVLRDDFRGLAIMSVYFLLFMPVSNLWWNCLNFWIVDFLTVLVIEAVALLTLGFPYAPVALAFWGLSLMMLKHLAD